MSILHLVRKSAFETSDFELCINTLQAPDQLVLLDDGCYNVLHPLYSTVNMLINNVSIIQPHAQARAIAVPTNTRLITMNELIELTFKHDSVVTWQ